MSRVQVWSCGGGRQSAGIAALIVQGRLPKPDHVCMAALEWERRATFRYVCDYVRPAMRSLGIPFTFISRKKYATKDFLGGADCASILLPAYTDQSGEKSKLPEWCSGEWKRECATRWAAERPGWKARGVDCWVGITVEEQHRRRAPRKQWFAPAYPLLDVLHMHVSGCLEAVAAVGWPEPPRSRCYHCPNQSDAEWSELTSEEFALACARDDWMRTIDPHAYLHRSLRPLRTVTLDPKADGGGLFGGCQAGMCY
jgi:hypothetical protein